MPVLNPILGNVRTEILTPQERDKISTGTDVPLGQSWDVDRDQFGKVNMNLAISGGLEAVEEARARNQSTAALVGKGAVNLVGSALFEVAKLPGYAVGGVGALATGDISPMVDNAWIRGVEWLQENSQGKLGEVYTPKDISEGGLMKQISSPYFWANEGANGIGFMLSFLAPGQVLKALGLGGKAAAGLAKVGKLAEVVADGEKIIQGGNAFGKLMLKTMGKSGRALDFGRLAGNIDSGLAVASNTMFESAAEASEIYDKVIQEGGTKEDASLAASQTFKMNMALLAVSNLFVEKYLFDGFGRSLVKPRSITSDVIKGSKEISNSLLKASASKLPLAAASGILQEGLFEEGLQTAIQQVKGSNLSDVLEKYGEDLSGIFGDDPDAIEFGKSVFLGGVLGGGMGTVAGVNEARRENNFLFGQQDYTPNKLSKFIGFKATEATPGAIELLRNSYKALKKDKSSLYKFDANGKIVGFVDGVKDKIADSTQMEVLSNYYNDIIVNSNGDVAAANKQFTADLLQAGGNAQDIKKVLSAVIAPRELSNTEALSYVRHLGNKKYLDNFMQMEGGEELAKAHIEDQLEAVSDRYEANTGVKMTSSQLDDIRTELLSELTRSAKLHKFIDADHSQNRIGINPIKEGEENPEQVVQKYSDFFNRVKHSRLELLRDIEYFQDRMNAAPDEEKALFANVINDFQERYKSLSTRAGIQKSWDEWNQATTKVEEAKAVEKVEAKPSITRDAFWDEVKAAGYSVEVKEDGTNGLNDSMNIRVNANGKSYTVETIKNDQGKTKLKLSDPLDPKNVRLFDNIRALYDAFKGKVSVIPREEVLRNMRERQAQRVQADKARAEYDTRVAMDQKLSELAQLDENIDKEIQAIDVNIDIAKEKIKPLVKQKTVEAKKSVKELRQEIAKLESLKVSLQEKRKVLQAQADVLKKYLELAKQSSLAQINQEEQMVQGSVATPEMIEEFKNYDIAKLDSAIQTADEILQEIDTKISSLSTVRDILDEMVQREETNTSVLNKDYTAEFAQKYSYVRNGKVYQLPNATKEALNALENKITKRIDKHLDQISLQTGQDPKELRKEFIEDAKKLIVSKEIQSAVEQAGGEEQAIAKMMAPYKDMTIDKIANLQKTAEQVADYKTLAESMRRVKALQSLTKELNSKFRRNQANRFKKQQDPSQQVPEEDGGENTYDALPIKEGDPFWEHALSDELYGSTGLSILYTRTGDDLYERVGDEYVPKANPSPYQQAFFRWIETATPGSFKVEARVVYYDSRDGDLEQAFSEANPTDRDAGRDINVVILNKKGEIMYDDKGIPLFTSIRRSSSKFPQGEKPKMNMYSLFKLYILDHLGVPDEIIRESLVSDILTQKVLSYKLREAAAKELQVPIKDVDAMSLKEFFDALEPLAISWGRNMYDLFLENIRANNVVTLPVVGITKGHPVRVLDDAGDIKTYPVAVSLGLELYDNGKPKNFKVYKANYKGNISVGNKVIGGHKPGVVYIKKNNEDTLIPVIQDSLDNNEIELILNILAATPKFTGLRGVTLPIEYPEDMNIKVRDKVFGPKGEAVPLFPDVDSKFSVLNLLMMWGSAGTNLQTYDIFIREGVLYFGTSSLSLTSISRAVQANDQVFLKPLVDFLQTKRSHISYEMLEASMKNGGAYYHPTWRDGKIVFQKHKSYLDYIFSRTTSDVVPKAVLDKFNLPQFAQKNLQFGDPQAKKKEEPKAVAEPKKAGKATNSSLADKIKEIADEPSSAQRNALMKQVADSDRKQELVGMLRPSKAVMDEIIAMGIVPKSDDIVEFQAEVSKYAAIKVLLDISGETAKLTASPQAAIPTTSSLSGGSEIEQIKEIVEDASNQKMKDLLGQLVAKGVPTPEVVRVARPTKEDVDKVVKLGIVPKNNDILEQASLNTKYAQAMVLVELAKKYLPAITKAEARVNAIEEAANTPVAQEATEGLPTGVFTETLQEVRRLYTSDKSFFPITASGSEAWEVLNSQGRVVTAEDIYNIKEKIGGKLFDFFARAYEYKTGKQLTQEPDFPNTTKPVTSEAVEKSTPETKSQNKLDRLLGEEDAPVIRKKGKFDADQRITTTDLLDRLVDDNTIQKNCA